MILVTGATGNVGRNLVRELLDAGARVRALTRDPRRAGLPDGVDVVRGDLTDAESLASALRGVERAFLFPVHGRLGAFLDAATRAGLKQVVLLSSQSVVDEHLGRERMGRLNAADEQAVIASGVPWTFLRPGPFMVNDLPWAWGVKAEGVVRAAYGDAATAPVDERDIAAVAARALLDDDHVAQAYELTGPQSLTQVERVRILGEVLGRELRFEELSPEAARERMTRHLEAETVDSLLRMFARQSGTTVPVSTAVRDVTGRPAHTYAEWAAHHAGDFR
ncbi:MULTISPECIES: NAD(P)H-binding protein [Streptomyces]|uniref:NAD(P)H-binding protein n=1 Tax=Streptomyces TaxID=1883 RepID=UPI001674FAE5|nr:MULTISPECIES: NAD(P)H-binding protein [Streptomyces]MBK3525417.1 NAD(P)H-binding protein [Streptomyces sp. MBT70]GGR94024.1 nucleotide-diphosphate-sugar epimerase [Streptomyces eurythermus]